MGDPAGIGPEICLKACHSLAESPPLTRRGEPTALILYGDESHCRTLAAWLSIDVGPLTFVDTKHFGPYTDGQASPQAGQAAAAAITAAANDCLSGRLSAMVTAPIHKTALHMAGVPHPGHTEMLAALSATVLGQTPDVRMMLLSSDLCVVLDSIHVSLKTAIESLHKDHLVDTLRVAQQAAPHLGLKHVRIALAALNPHASDGGLFGEEEARILTPAITRAQQQGILVTGPLPADTAFMKALGKTAADRDYDVVVCLYHDQGLIPIKLRGIDDGVNITLGLPFVRTSVDHGTAFDIAGKNLASPASLISAIHRAATCLY